jgi:cation diffusion facilitator CzcD-associated flavoprotein CzcO
MTLTWTDPGARVDTDLPVYQFFDQKIWQDFTFSERFPGFRELQKYFEYYVEKMNLRKDILYEKDVKSAWWLKDRNRWEVTCSDGTISRCKWLFANVGFAAKKQVELKISSV